MTMAVIVACKNSFYIVADTLMIDSSTKSYTLNNQKVFFSDKHKIGLCIAGQANLISKNLDTHSINVGYIVKKFFEYIDDNVPEISIEKLGSLLEEYVDTNYRGFHNYFKFQTPGTANDNDVSYFYGGFRKSEQGENDVVIYSHHVGEIKEANYNSAVPYFSNVPIAVSSYIDFALRTAPSNKTKEENLATLLDDYKDYVLTQAIPQACIVINNETIQDKDTGQPVIGNCLHRVSVDLDSIIEHRYIQYSGQDVNSVVSQDISIPNYILYETEAQAISANPLAYKLIDAVETELQRYIDNSSYSNVIGESGYSYDQEHSQQVEYSSQQ
jgi:hypothetical protein